MTKDIYGGPKTKWMAQTAHAAHTANAWLFNATKSNERWPFGQTIRRIIYVYLCGVRKGNIAFGIHNPKFYSVFGSVYLHKWKPKKGY